ncbi:MAG: cytochrome P450 [Gammaproteobacteria bacterium]|nr:cytochrome P450 [Gammaproteobacteria bacterium]
MSAKLHETVLHFSAHPLLWGLARLARRAGPLWKVPGLGVIVSDAECAREILRRDHDFTKNGVGSFAQAMTAALGPMALGNMDGDDHRCLRTAIADVLAPARADLLVRDHADDVALLCTRLARGDRVDLAHFTRGWSGRIAFDVVGIAPPPGAEEEACYEIVRLSERMASEFGFGDPSKRQVRIALADRERLAAYFRAGYERSALPSSLVDRLQTLGFTFDQAAGLLLFYVIAGTLTISAALPRIVALLVDSGAFAQLRKDPTGIPQAIDEGLRFITPLPATVRIVQRDTVVQGHRLTAHTRLVILTHNLARDEKLFPDPDRFDITRVHNPQAARLWYGAGPHRCAGFNLAQRELKAALHALVGVGRDFRIVKRRASIGALIPAYARLVIQTVPDL